MDTHRTFPSTQFEKLFTRAEMAADLDFLIRTCESVHPDLYHAVSKERVAEYRRAVIMPQIQTPMKRFEFYTIAAKWMALFKDGHTSVVPPIEEWGHFARNGGKVLPVDVEVREERLEVVGVYADDTSIGVGDAIVAINGRPSESIIESFLSENGGDSIYMAGALNRRFHLHLWLHGINEPFFVDFLPQGGNDARRVTLHGLTRKEIGARRAAIEAPKPRSPFRFERLPGDIGYIDFRSMNDFPGFRKFLRSTFSEARAKPIRGLIIDLRNNGGGDSRLGDELLSYITDKPYRMAGRKEWKVSPEYKRFLVSQGTSLSRWINADTHKYLTTPDGELAVFEGKPQPAKPQALRYRGPVCFLIGSGTFSSAMMLANAVSDYELATLIGEEAGGAPNAFGEVYGFDLPHTGLYVGVSSAKFVRASGDLSDKLGVVPDFVMGQTAEDIKHKVDAVLECAKRWILDQRLP